MFSRAIDYVITAEQADIFACALRMNCETFLHAKDLSVRRRAGRAFQEAMYIIADEVHKARGHTLDTRLSDVDRMAQELLFQLAQEYKLDMPQRCRLELAAYDYLGHISVKLGLTREAPDFLQPTAVHVNTPHSPESATHRKDTTSA